MAKAKSKSFVAPVGTTENVLSDGRVMVPGEPIDLDDEAQADEHNARLIEEGHLIEVESSAQTQSTQNGGEG